MLSGKEKLPPPQTRAEGPPKTEPEGRQEVDPCEPSLHDTVKSARTGPSDGSHEHTREKKISETGGLEEGVLDPQPSTRSPEQRLVLCSSESHPRSRGVEEDHHGASTDTPRNAVWGDVPHGPEAVREMENPGPRQTPPSSQPVTPSALPLHLIPLLPQQSPSSKRQRRSIGLSSNQADKVSDDFSERGSLPNDTTTGGASPSPQSLRSRLQNFSAESGAGISRTLAYAMDQMNATHSSEYLPLLEETVMTREAEVDREGDAATRPKTVRFEESTCQPAELAERLWTNAVQAIAATARTHEESEQKVERTTQSGEKDEGATCGQDTTVAGGRMETLPEGDAQSFLQKLGAVTLGKAEEGKGKDANAWYASEGGSQRVEPEVEDARSEAERATPASQTLKPAQPQEYARLKEREVELRNVEAECRIIEERLEAREKGLRNRLRTVRQRLEAVRQRRASINRQEEILRQKLEGVRKECYSNALGADAPPESTTE